MGAPFIDYILADRLVIPEGQEIHYSEKVVYLPHSYLPTDGTRAIAEATPSRAECGLPESGFVFACFNNTHKIAPEVFDVWMRLLRRVEGSVLWLRSANPGAAHNLRREAVSRNVSPERLVFAPRVPGPEEHLARIRMADLFLDTLPYNAHATAIDALWAGLPVLTCMGGAFPGRVAAGLLHAIGLPELVTASLSDYESLALALARDPARLESVRATLARNRGTHPLFDTARYTRELESAYVTMWERCRAGLPPAGFQVAAAP
jgi:predicted O-linked N-acetylglucosamine transferase (SPINDLY family)